MNTPYHDWLVRRRIYCESPNCMDKLTRAEVVRNINGRDTVLCEWHGRSLDSIRGNKNRSGKTERTGNPV